MGVPLDLEHAIRKGRGPRERSARRLEPPLHRLEAPLAVEERHVQPAVPLQPRTHGFQEREPVRRGGRPVDDRREHVLEAIGLLVAVAGLAGVPRGPLELLERRGRLAGPEAQLAAERERTAQAGFVAVFRVDARRGIDLGEHLLPRGRRRMEAKVDEREGGVGRDDGLVERTRALQCLGEDGLRALHVRRVPVSATEQRHETQPHSVVHGQERDRALQQFRGGRAVAGGVRALSGRRE